MRIQYCSDLHIEFDQNRSYLSSSPLDVSGDILILAGDIVLLQDEFLNDPFFTAISGNYKHVFWIPGNHEYYYRNISEYNTSFNILVHNNISIVNNVEIHYEGIRFVFSTLWSRISKENEKYVEQSVSDFECINANNQKFKVSDFNRLHEESLSFIKQSLKQKNSKTVVVTHHLPSLLCNSAIQNDSPINEAFCVDLSEYIESCDANFWIYGHSHFNQKPLYIGSTIMLTNQLGYVHLNEHRSFKHDAYFSV